MGLEEVRKYAADVGLRAAASARRRLDELRALVREVECYHSDATVVDVVALPSTYGKRGQGEANRSLAALHLANGTAVAGVVKLLCRLKGLAASTARRYVREAQKV